MSKHSFTCIEGHTEGMPVRMVIAGAPELTGTNMSERRREFEAEYDWVRRTLMLEPRGHSHMSGTLFYPPVSPNADFSLLFIETSGCLPMCGHALIGSITFAIECGLIKAKQRGQVVVDVPAGQITASYELKAGKVTSVRFNNVPSFLLYQDVKIFIPQLGRLKLDIAYGGNFYPIIDIQANYPGCEHFTPEQLLQWGVEIQRLVNTSLEVVHPDDSTIQGVKHCMWTGHPFTKSADGCSVVIAGNNLIDRSPGGTGTSALVAQRHRRGWLTKGQTFHNESIIGSRFIGRVESQTTLSNGYPAVNPSIEGSAWVTGKAEFYIDREQPYWNGFSLGEFASAGSL
ncbi:4-hydroxyproline epimerase [Pseudomonas sp. MOB-449]|nr:4-hydroxyproline epimerase [Pseudomonas sp. MOB-449]